MKGAAEDFSLHYHIEKPYFTEEFSTTSIVADANGKKYFATEYSKSSELASRTDEIRNFYEELKHPFIAPLLEISRDAENGIDYFIFDFESRGFLLNALSKDADSVLSFTKTELQTIVFKISSVINFVHSKGFVLRNVTLSNFLIDENNNPLLWSLAQTCRIGDFRSCLDSSPHVCPPECAHQRGQQQQQQSEKSEAVEIGVEYDSYSLGGLMLLLFGGGFRMIGFSLRTFAPPPVMMPQPPEEETAAVKELILALMSRNKAERPTIAEVLEKLQKDAFLNGVDIDEFKKNIKDIV